MAKKVHGKRSGAPRKRAPRRPSPPHFVGRDPSPVLDKYPPKEAASSLRAPAASPQPPRPISPTSSGSPPSAGPTGPPSQPLITLDRPFDVDEFSSLLGETSIRVTVPRESLPEVLHRLMEFMGFGIYVYSITVRPAPAELLKSFLVELQRVDYSAEKGTWVPFVEKGTTDSPFGPGADRS